MPTIPELEQDVEDAKEALTAAILALDVAVRKLALDTAFVTIAAVKVDFDAENISAIEAVSQIDLATDQVAQ